MGAPCNSEGQLKPYLCGGIDLNGEKSHFRAECPHWEMLVNRAQKKICSCMQRQCVTSQVLWGVKVFDVNASLDAVIILSLNASVMRLP